MNWRIGSIVAFWFLVSVIVYVIIKNWGVEYWWDPATWQIVAAIATWLLAGGVGFAILQVRQARKSTNAQLTVDFYWKFRDPETVKKLRCIYDLKPEDFGDLSENERHEIDYVLDWLDTLGFLIREKIVDKLLAIEVFGGLIALRCWYKLAHYIKEERSNRGYFAENCEGLVRLSRDYFENAGIQAKLYGIDLLAELQKEELHPRTFEQIQRERKKNKNAEVKRRV